MIMQKVRERRTTHKLNERSKTGQSYVYKQDL